MKVETISGRVWQVEAQNEKRETFWALVVAETPEQCLKSFRDQFPGHTVREAKVLLATHVIVPA